MARILKVLVLELYDNFTGPLPSLYHPSEKNMKKTLITNYKGLIAGTGAKLQLNWFQKLIRMIFVGEDEINTVWLTQISSSCEMDDLSGAIEQSVRFQKHDAMAGIISVQAVQNCDIARQFILESFNALNEQIPDIVIAFFIEEHTLKKCFSRNVEQGKAALRDYIISNNRVGIHDNSFFFVHTYIYLPTAEELTALHKEIFQSIEDVQELLLFPREYRPSLLDR